MISRSSCMIPHLLVTSSITFAYDYYRLQHFLTSTTSLSSGTALSSKDEPVLGNALPEIGEGLASFRHGPSLHPRADVVLDYSGEHVRVIFRGADHRASDRFTEQVPYTESRITGLRET